MVCRGYFGQRPSGFELVQHLGCLGVQTRRDFLLAPARLDLVLDLVERTFARRRDAGDVVPDVAVLKPQGVTFDADIGGKRPGEKPLRVGKLHRRACSIAAGAIDRLDGARLELQIGGGLGQRFALCARILDLVVEVENLGFGARGGQLLLEFAGHLLERANLLRLDLEDLHQHGAEAALHRHADLAFLEREGGIGRRPVDYRGFGHRAEIDVLFALAELLADLGEARAFRDALRSRARRLGIGKIDLQDVTPLGGDIARAPLLIGAFEIRVGDFDPTGLLVRDQRHDHELAVFGRAKLGLALLEVLRKHLWGRRRNLAGERAVEQHVFDRALLVLIAVHRLDQRPRRAQAGSDGARELPAQRQTALFGDKAGLGVAGITDDLLETKTVELAVRPAKRRIVGNQFGDLGVGERETERVRALVEQDLRKYLRDRRPVQAYRPRLIWGDRAAELPRILLQPIVVQSPELLDCNFGTPDLGDGGAAEAAENVTDSPDRETDHQEADNGGHHRLAEPVGRGFS